MVGGAKQIKRQAHSTLKKKEVLGGKGNIFMSSSCDLILQNSFVSVLRFQCFSGHSWQLPLACLHGISVTSLNVKEIHQ